jgi:hypothetical protein
MKLCDVAKVGPKDAREAKLCGDLQNSTVL